MVSRKRFRGNVVLIVERWKTQLFGQPRLTQTMAVTFVIGGFPVRQIRQLSRGRVPRQKRRYRRERPLLDVPRFFED